MFPLLFVHYNVQVEVWQAKNIVHARLARSHPHLREVSLEQVHLII